MVLIPKNKNDAEGEELQVPLEIIDDASKDVEKKIEKYGLDKVDEKKKIKKKEKQEMSEEDREKELIIKYGITKGIPKQKIDEDLKEEEAIKERVKTTEEFGSFTGLLMKVEQLEGKMEIIGSYKTELEERLSHLSEEVGEIRSMILEVDKSFGKIENEFEKIKETIGDIEPLKIKKVFEKKDREIEEVRTKIERLEEIVKEIGNETENFRKTMEKIKSFENLVDVAKRIDEKIRLIDDTKKYSDRTSAKVEALFSEISEKVNELELQKEKISKLDELTTEITQMLDEISIKINDYVTSKDLKKLKEELKEEMKKIKPGGKEFDEIFRIIKERESQKAQVTQQPLNIGQMGEIKTGGKDIEDSTLTAINQRIEKIKQIIEKQNEVISEVINRIEGLKLTQIKSEEIKNVELYLRFYHLLNVIPFIEDQEQLKIYSIKIKEILEELKASPAWDEQKEKMIEELIRNSKSMVVPHKTDEIIEKITKLTAWVSSIADQIKNRGPMEEDLKNELEKLKAEVRNKVNVGDIEDVYIVEREINKLDKKFSKIKLIIEEQNKLLSETLKKLDRLELDKIEANKKVFEEMKLGVRFYQLLNMLPYVIEPTRVRNYMNELKDIIEEMRKKGQWDDEKEKFMKNFLGSLSDTYKSRGYEEIASAYSGVN
ncbi:MAG: hypothetical protein QXY45_03600 [Candidatus Aenigmatarchaeota archaeon]